MYNKNLTTCALLIITSVGSTAAQTAENSCAGVGKISLESRENDSDATLTYFLSNPGKAAAAWVEVWDRPQLLFRKQVPLEIRGEVTWKPKADLADTPSELEIAPLNKTAKGLVPFVLVGITRDEGGPTASLVGTTQILEEGREPGDLTLRGNLLTPQTKILLMEHEGDGWIAREYLSGTLPDLRHIQIQIPPGYLSRSTILALAVMPDALFPAGVQVNPGSDSVRVYVTSPDRPRISAVEPAVVPSDSTHAGVGALVHGSGFRPDSQATTLFGENGNDLATKAHFISPSELLVTLPCCYSYAEEDIHTSDRVELWIRNGDDFHVSEPVGVDFLFAGRLPPRPNPKAFITAVSPYPVPLMDSQSPAFMPLHVYGEHFREDEYVLFSYGMGDDDPPNAKLATKFISPTELLVTLPRELWRHHRLSYRLVTETERGTCDAELWDDPDTSPF